MTTPETLVHNKETSDRYRLSASFQQHIAHRNYPAWHASGNLYAHVDAIEGSQYVETFLGCRTQSWFARHKTTGEVRVIGSCCKLRWCRLCADAKRTYISSQVAAWLKSTSFAKFITFTLKHNDEDLTFQIKRLYDSFRKIRRTKIWRRGALRGVWFFQIKRSKKSGQWHPHLHCIISGPWFDYKKLRETWLSITGDSKVIGIHPVRDPAGCANEVARYASAPANLETNRPDDYHTIWKALHGKRICGAWGLKDVVALTPPSLTDKDEWEDVGTWQSVQDLQQTDSRARAIIEAWSNRASLNPGINMYASDKPSRSMLEIAKEYELSDYDPTFFD